MQIAVIWPSERDHLQRNENHNRDCFRGALRFLKSECADLINNDQAFLSVFQPFCTYFIISLYDEVIAKLNLNCIQIQVH